LTLHRFLIVAASGCVATAAWADNGYFQLGYGAEARAVAGAAAASTRDAFGAAVNPATTVWVGNRLDAGLAVTTGQTQFLRQAGLPPPLAGVLDTDVESDRRYEPLGELAYSGMLAPDQAVSVVLYSNGAGNFLPAETTQCLAPPPAPPGTVYRGNALCGTGRIVTSLKQLIVAPTLSYRLAESLSVGGSLLLAGQVFKAEGLQALAAQSASPGNVSDRGAAYAYGVGLRLGALWRPHDMLTLGGSWSPRISMSRLKKYEGFLADRGRLDVPANLTVGVELSPVPALAVLADYQRIDFRRFGALGNAPFDGSSLRGSPGGPGSGWRNVEVFKLGVRYQVTPAIRVSAGASANSRVYAEADTTHNITSPSTFRRHYTWGAGYTTTDGAEWSVYFGRSTRVSTTGPSGLGSAVVSQITGTPTVAGQESLATSNEIFGIQLSIRY
jgi:long-chain fatty acid transport protein